MTAASSPKAGPRTTRRSGAPRKRSSRRSAAGGSLPGSRAMGPWGHATCTIGSLMERSLVEHRGSGAERGRSVTVFLCGDVMTGRGIDQVLPHPCDPRIHEPFVDDAREYVRLAETASGPVPHPVELPYIWGDALDELARLAPDARIVNLETSITGSDDRWPDKEIHYRMHPDNVGCLTSAGIDVCALANNHVLDFGHEGLRETLRALARAGIKTAGAGLHLAEAREPALVEISGTGRLVVFAFGDETSGIPASWAATDDRPGIDLLPDLSETTAGATLERLRRVKGAGV